MSRKRTSASSSNAAPAALACPACGRAHEDAGERFCRDCGMPLVHAGDESAEEPRSGAHERARKIRPELTRGPLARVAGGRNQAEAELIQNILLEEGVPSVLRRTAGFDVPDFLAAGPRDILVPESGAEAAREVLLQSDLAPPEPSGRSGPRPTRLAAAVVALGGAGALVAWVLFELTG